MTNRPVGRGDCIVGAYNRSALGTLVESTFRYTRPCLTSTANLERAPSGTSSSRHSICGAEHHGYRG